MELNEVVEIDLHLLSGCYEILTLHGHRWVVMHSLGRSCIGLEGVLEFRGKGSDGCDKEQKGEG